MLYHERRSRFTRIRAAAMRRAFSAPPWQRCYAKEYASDAARYCRAVAVRQLAVLDVPRKDFMCPRGDDDKIPFDRLSVMFAL